MSELDDYDKRCDRVPLTTAEVAAHVAAVRRHLERADPATAVERERVVVWLADHLRETHRIIAAVNDWQHQRAQNVIDAVTKTKSETEIDTEPRGERLRKTMALEANSRQLIKNYEGM